MQNLIKRFQILKMIPKHILGVVLLLLLATSLFMINTMNSMQASFPIMATVRFEGDYRIGDGDVLCHDSPYYRINTNLVDCDYYTYLNIGKPSFYGEYMSQYSWAESTCSLLQFKK